MDNMGGDPTMETVRFELTGDDDPDELETNLSGLQGVRSVEADPNGGSVTISFDSAIVDDNAIREALESSGYHIKSQTSNAPGS